MKFFYMEKWCKRAVILLFFCSIFGIMITSYYIYAAKLSWSYRIDVAQCKKKKGIIEKTYNGQKIKAGRILKYLKLNNGDQICILRKEEEYEEYPDITRKELKGIIIEGETITYLKDEKNKINNYNLCYAIVFFIILSIGAIGCTIYFYWIADTKDMYIYDD